MAQTRPMTRIQDGITEAQLHLPKVLERLEMYEAPAYQRFCAICGDSFVAAAFDHRLCGSAKCAAVYLKESLAAIAHEMDTEYEGALETLENLVDEQRVYFIRSKATGLIKIGTSWHPPERMRSLQDGSGEAMELLVDILGDRRVERFFHDQFADCRKRGEWFWPIPELLELVDELQAEREDG